MFSWLDAREAEEFGNSLATFFMERIPAEISGKKESSLAKRKEVLGKMFMQILKFKGEHKMNMYKKAKLGNAFKWALLEAKYDPQFVDELTKTLMVKL